MPDEPTDPEAPPAADVTDAAPEAVPAEATTPSGYQYEVVADGDEPSAPDSPASVKSSGGVPIWSLIPAIVFPALLVGMAVWFVFGRDSGGGSGSLASNTTNLLNAFTAGNGETETIRYEGELPPGYPDDIPAYEGAEIAGSVLQISGEDAGYIVVSGSDDGRDAVAAELKAKFGEDPWQLDGAQDGANSTLYQFSRIDDANTTGIVLLAPSKDGSRTTIITSIQEVSGAADHEPETFEEPLSRSAPDGFPDDIPVYEGAVLIESAYQKEAGATSFRVSYITKDDAGDVLAFYRNGLEDNDLTVEDGDATTSPLVNAEVIRFSDEDLQLNGEVAVGEFDADDTYTRIDIQAGDER